jgi:hypothetical protein
VGGNPIQFIDPTGLLVWFAVPVAYYAAEFVVIAGISAYAMWAIDDAIYGRDDSLSGIVFNENSCPVDGGEHEETSGHGTEIWGVEGEYDDAVDDFKDKVDGKFEDKGNGVLVGKDKDGNTVVVRPGGSKKYGSPSKATVEIQPADGGHATDKIRYW